MALDSEFRYGGFSQKIERDGERDRYREKQKPRIDGWMDAWMEVGRDGERDLMGDGEEKDREMESSMNQERGRLYRYHYRKNGRYLNVSNISGRLSLSCNFGEHNHR